MIDTFLAILPLLGIAFVLLGIRVLLKKGGTFHSQHVGQSKAMRQRGIECVQAQDRIEHASTKNVDDMQK